MSSRTEVEITSSTRTGPRTHEARPTRQVATLDQPPGLQVSLSTGKILWILGLCIFVLATAHIVVMTLYHLYFTFNRFLYFSSLFNLNQEANPASWYSSFGLLICAALLALIALDKRRKRATFTWHWAFLALTFLYISIDETGSVHERTIIPMRTALGLTGFFFYGWVVLAIPVLVVFGLSYLRFLRHLPRRFQVMFCLAALVYVSGALGVEMIEGYYDDLLGGGGESDLTFALMVAVEEVFEMLGVLILIRALMEYIRTFVGELHLRLTA